MILVSSSRSLPRAKLLFLFTAVFGGFQVATAFRVVSLPWSSAPATTTTFTTTTTSYSSSVVVARRRRGDSGPFVLSASTSTSSTQTMDSSSSTGRNMILLNGVRDLVDGYDVFLLDMWGVMHDGSRPYPGVLEAVQNLCALNKKLVILSNSSKRLDDSIRMLQKLGFDPCHDFDQIITSGEVAYQMLHATGDHSIQRQQSSSINGEKVVENNNNNNNLLLPRGCSPWSVLVDIQDLVKQGKTKHNVFVFGSGDGDEEYCQSAGWKLSSLDEASLIIARGTFTINDGSGVVVDKGKNAKEYQDMLHEHLAQAARRQIPMLVTNPDKIRPDADCNPMPGQIGDAYEKALLECNKNNMMDAQQAECLVKRIGKPDLDVYKIALHGLEERHDYSRAVMIGDALETDITGGSIVGIDTVWVLLDGIHSSELAIVVADNNGDDADGNGDDDDDKDGGIVAKEKENNLLLKRAGVVLETFNNKKGTYAKDRQLTPMILLKHFCW